MHIQIIYDTPIEVTKSQYDKAMSTLRGAVAGQEMDGKFFIKLWFMRYKKKLAQILQ